jgi:GntR family transcriptional regulator
MSKGAASVFRMRSRYARLLQRSPRRVHDLLRTSIRDGLLGPDDRLNEHALVHELATSRNAVREGLQMLASLGLVERAPRIGTTIVGGLVRIPLDPVPGRHQPDGMMVQRLEDRIVPSTALIRERLHTDAEFVGMIEHMYSLGGKPLGVRAAYYHSELRPDDGWGQPLDLDTAFEFVWGAPVGRVDTAINALVLDARTCRLLEAPAGTPGLVKEQVVHDADAVPQEFAYSHWRADRVSFTVSRLGMDGPIIPG